MTQTVHSTLDLDGNAIDDFLAISQYDDLRFPLARQPAKNPADRLVQNLDNGTLVFNADSRYPEEAVSMICQLQHDWEQGTPLYPHLHWIQQGSAEPNWLLKYKLLRNGAAVTIETDYSNHIVLEKTANVFAYTAPLVQITKFAAIDMSAVTGVSHMVHFVLFRDSTDESEEFDGADPSIIAEHAIEFDIHYKKDRLGSRQEYTK